MKPRILFISNGHGEDLNGSRILAALTRLYPHCEALALPLVGEGLAYQSLGVPLLAPTRTLPSGGLIYTHPLNWLRDLGGGLAELTLRQIWATWQIKEEIDFCLAVGDLVPLLFARLTGRPFGAFLVSTSAYYEGYLELPAPTALLLRSPRCRRIWTRDAYTARDLQRRGFGRADYAGYPILDGLEPQGVALGWDGAGGKIALFPGSRAPEALGNLARLLALAREMQGLGQYQFRAALVSAITEADLRALAKSQNWDYLGAGLLRRENCEVGCYWGAFNDILGACDLALGMAGTAVEQAVGLGKPVVQIPGPGPQFTYAFAEAQTRLLGPSVTTVAAPDGIPRAARLAAQILADEEYLAFCRLQGAERVGAPGGSAGLARALYACLETGAGDGEPLK
ncbi:MAG: hypothetical protein GC158_13050 [Cyanobacteria bacterium RI_101]|nr:hypothetical protein [Cyanobacteria bacterium RI_101]